MLDNVSDYLFSASGFALGLMVIVGCMGIIIGIDLRKTIREIEEANRGERDHD